VSQTLSRFAAQGTAGKLHRRGCLVRLDAWPQLLGGGLHGDLERLAVSEDRMAPPSGSTLSSGVAALHSEAIQIKSCPERAPSAGTHHTIDALAFSHVVTFDRVLTGTSKVHAVCQSHETPLRGPRTSPTKAGHCMIMDMDIRQVCRSVVPRVRRAQI